MVGDDASLLRSQLEVNYPIENGIVRNWEDMEHLWDFTFGPEKLDIDPRYGFSQRVVKRPKNIAKHFIFLQKLENFANGTTDEPNKKSRTNYSGMLELFTAFTQL